MKRLLTSIGLMIGAALAMACGDGAAVYPNNDGIPNNCEYLNGQYFERGHFARFDNNNRRLTLVDWNTGDTVFVLATDIDAANTTVLEWSPSCQYLVTHQDGAGVFYDVVNGRQIASFPRMRGYSRRDPSVVFDQGSRFAYVEADGQTFLLNLGNGQASRMTDYVFDLLYWDFDRNQIIGLADSEVAIFDLATGAKVTSFGDLNLGRRPGMVFSPDRSWLAFHSDNRLVNVINRDSGARVDINVDYYIYDRESILAISPGNRWLAIGGWRVNVWDLQNPPGDVSTRTQHSYNFDGPANRILDIHFMDNGVIETITTGNNKSYWNMTSGEAVAQ